MHNTNVSIYHGMQRYMLTYGGDMGKETCTMIDKRKHVSQCMAVHTYIWRYQGY